MPLRSSSFLKLAIGAVIGLSIPVLALITLILVSSVPQLTSLTIFYSRIPTILSSTYLDAAILQQNTNGAVSSLRKQGAYARILGNNNLMRSQLIENTYMVYESITDDHDYLILADWLEELEQLLAGYESYWFDLMNSHVKALQNSGDGTQTAKGVTAIYPAFDRPYRPAVKRALEDADYPLLKKLCDNYKTAKYNFLALNPYKRYRYHAGQYDSSIILLPNGKTSATSLQSHRAFVTTQPVPYQFKGGLQEATRSLSLSYRSLPGIRLKVESISFSTGKETTVYYTDNLTYAGKYGFVLEDGSYLLTNSMHSDVITFSPIKGLFPKSDSVIFNLQFEKLALAKTEQCMQTPGP